MAKPLGDAVSWCWRAACFVVVRAWLGTAVAVALVLGALAHTVVVQAVVCAVALAAYFAVATARSGRARDNVRLLGRSAVATPGRRRPGREVALAAAEVLLGPVELGVLVGWLVGAPLLVVAPLAPGASDGGWLLVAAGLAILAAGGWMLVILAEAHGALVHRLLGPEDVDLRARLGEVTRSRARLVGSFDAERRRIERDLHDGAQQQLVALAMKLDLAGIELERQRPELESARLVREAHAQANAAVGELRDLVQGIYPPVLEEQGLGGALERLAARSAVPVQLRVALARRLPEPVESTAYFVAAEAMTNAARHARATRLTVDARLVGDVLELCLQDDGVGGADTGVGGLIALRDRIAALDGELTVTSPPGGPTRIRVLLHVSGH